MSLTDEGRRLRLMVVGCGGIGGVVLAGLLEQGLAVTCLTRRAEAATRLRAEGLRLRDEHGERTVRGELNATHEPPEEGAYDAIFMATQPNQLEGMVAKVAHLLDDEGLLVCFQNGLCEERIAPTLERGRVAGGVIAWGASGLGPARVERTSGGGFTLGYLDGPPDGRLEVLGRMLEAVGPVELTDNLRGKRWSKLALNCAISSLGAIGGDRLGALLKHRFVRRLALETMSEAVEVARAEEVRLEKVAGTLDLNWLALTPAERRATAGSPTLFTKHGLLVAVGARYRRLRSSMLAAIEDGREPPVDFLNGEVVDRAARHGLSTPLNEAILSTVKALGKGPRRPSLETLRALYDRTRPTPAT